MKSNPARQLAALREERDLLLTELEDCWYVRKPGEDSATIYAPNWNVTPQCWA